jgi:phosphate acetyltransferase
MATSVYVAAVEGFTGKSTVALGVLEQLSRRVERVAVYRPVVRGDAATDYVLDLLVSHDAVQLELRRVRRRHVRRRAPTTRRVRSTGSSTGFHQVAAKVDAVVVVGSDYTDVGAPTEFSFNARLAANLGSPVLLCSTPTTARSTASAPRPTWRSAS